MRCIGQRRKKNRARMESMVVVAAALVAAFLGAAVLRATILVNDWYPSNRMGSAHCHC